MGAQPRARRLSTGEATTPLTGTARVHARQFFLPPLRREDLERRFRGLLAAVLTVAA